MLTTHVIMLNWFQHLFHLKTRQTLKRVQGDGSLGFTLIELLVVVLIIGILSAIALPQYEKAVLKSRFAAVKPLVSSLAAAQERYYMANGFYATALEDLDVEFDFVSKKEQSYRVQYQKENGNIVSLVVMGGKALGVEESFFGLSVAYRVIFANERGVENGTSGEYCVEDVLGGYGKYCPRILGKTASDYAVSNWIGRWYKI